MPPQKGDYLCSLNYNPKNTGTLPYQIRHHKDKTVELIVSLKGGCVRIWGLSEAEVINRYHTRNK
jgi:hypothetical protein